MGVERVRSAFQSKNFEFITDVMFQVDAIRKYIEVTQATIEIDVRNEIVKYQKLSDEERHLHYEMGYDFSEVEILSHTRNLYYSSIFISIASFLERKMLQLCKLAEGHHEEKLKDIKGTGIRKYHSYITSIVGVNLAKIEGLWCKALDNARIRNKLVHEHEILPDEVDLKVEVLYEYLSIVGKILRSITYESVR